MKWQQRIRVATGLSCWQIMLHLLVVALLVMGWMHHVLIHVGLALCVLYAMTLILMLAFQRHQGGWRRELCEFLEEMTTTWYFGAAMIAIWLLSNVVYNNVVLTIAGIVLLAGPAIFSLLVKDKRRSGDFASKHSVRR